MPTAETLHQAREWFQLVLLAANVVTLIVMWFVRSRQASKEQIETLAAAIASLANKESVAAVAARVLALEHAPLKPGWSAYDSIRDRLGQIEGELKGIKSNLEASKDRQEDQLKRLGRIETHLLEHGK